MATISTIISLIFFAIISSLLNLIILNIAGLPGAIFSGKPNRRSKVRLSLGILISFIGQLFVYLAYVAFIVNWTTSKINHKEVLNFLVWIFAFLASFLPILSIYNKSQEEYKNSNTPYLNPQVEALSLTLFFSFLAFWIFVFFPKLVSLFYGWLPINN